MELNSVLVAGVLLAAILALGAFVLAIWCFIELQAQKRSTHTVLPITPETTMQKIEKEIQNIVGPGQNDLNLDLHRAGLDPDDLV